MIEWIRANSEHLLAILALLYAAARAIVHLTPTPRDDELLAKVSPVLRAIAGLFGLDLRVGVEAKPDKGK